MTRPPHPGGSYWVALDPRLGSVIRKTRPALVISNDSRKGYGARVVVMPITSTVTSLYPGEVRIKVRGRRAHPGAQARGLLR